LSAPLFDELLGRLVRADVRFVVIGGLALGSWGVVRGTKDCDIVPDPAPENLDVLAHVAAELGGHVQLGESLLGSERSIASLVRGRERALISTRLGDLDVVQGLEETYGEHRDRVARIVDAIDDPVRPSACRPASL
jgi:hypothetical protein